MKIKVVKNPKVGIVYLKKLLYSFVDSKTVLFLSGGKTPKDLYEILAKEGKLKAKVVGMVDERSDRSNFEMIKKTGFLDYLKKAKINFYPIISSSSYDKKIRSLIKLSKNKIAIMGIGEDGHTASLPASPKLQRGEPAGISNFQFPISNKENLVVDVDSFPGEFKKRITLTFKALAEMDLLIVLAFGSAKKNALASMFKKGSLSEIPARFYTKPEITKKTILITDQKV